ncbi:MAG TPA: carbonic anhydrase [Bacteroidales bacterium]|nr:carbonic anhydrase [Bacteroidales bacterium]
MELDYKGEKKSLHYKRLYEGIKKFQTNEFIPRQQFFEDLGQNQNPHTLFIGCSDSRVVPNLITQTFPGELFVVRNIANLIPFYKKQSDTYLATTAAIEYAVNQMNVSNIIVCGHSNCGGCAALYQDKELKNLPHTRKWMELAHPVKKIVEEKIAKNKITIEQRSVITEQLNIVEQMAHLLKYSYIKKRVKDGSINVMGWYYNIEKGEIYNYDKELKRFIRLE